MGDSLKWAAEQADDRWLNSPEYKKRHALCSRQNAARAKAAQFMVKDLRLDDLIFLMSIPTYIDPQSHHPISLRDVKRLEILCLNH